MSGYDARDAARDTKVTPGEVKRAWHESRTVSGVRKGGTGDRPTPQNRADAKELTRKVMDRARNRPSEPER